MSGPKSRKRAQRPRHGYELRAAFEAVVGGAENWEVKPAQIYTTLSRMGKSGLVTAKNIMVWIEDFTKPEANMPLIQAENLTKVYGKGDTAIIALDHVTMSVNSGELVAVMGPSGCGVFVPSRRSHRRHGGRSDLWCARRAAPCATGGADGDYRCTEV